MIIFIETWKNNTIIKVKIEAWRKTEMDEKRFAIKETVSVEAVSYTHLDVYKRQPGCRLRR